MSASYIICDIILLPVSSTTTATLPNKRPDSHKLIEKLICDCRPTCLVVFYKLLQFHDALLLELPGQNISLLIASADLLELLVIVREEAEILERNVHVWIAAELTMLLYRGTTA